MTRRTVLVTGANGYIGNAVAKAFSGAGWQTFGLIRREEDAADLARAEVCPIVGALDERAAFDVVVSNTEDRKDPAAHFEKVRLMLREIAGAGPRPLVLFTSGCKDYGPMPWRHGDPALSPHTEQSPLNAPRPLVPRKDFGVALLGGESRDLFDAAVLRPTIVYGHTSSHYGSLFDLAAESRCTLRISAAPNAIMHSLHVDDCARAYVALAEHPARDEVAGHAFNISNAMYETAEEVGGALARAYGLSLELTAPDAELPFHSVEALFNFSQWVSSDKLRTLTGWSERKPTFASGMLEYRRAYEASGPLCTP